MAKKTESKSIVEKEVKAPKTAGKAIAPAASSKPAVTTAKKVETPVQASTKPAKKSVVETVTEKVAEVFSSEKKIPSHEAIQIQAYFVAERRRAAGLPGDAASDWTEAERELRA